MLKKFEIDNFLHTENTLQFDFCEGINIFIGENDTGKTVLLTEIYSKESPIFSKESAIYIPAVNIISYSRSMVALDHKYRLPFDKAMIDIIQNAQLPELRKNTEWQTRLLTKIEKIIKGIVVYENDAFYIQKDSGEKTEFKFVANGYTKLGLLWKLIKNGLFEPGRILLWDEPENSLSPKLMKDLAEILLSLAEVGVQIFIATHNYSLVRWFELLKKEKNTLRYFNLFATENGISYNQADDYTSLGNVFGEVEEDIQG
jgi:predicted ATP-dependent endonuclease of OLD family